MRNAGRGTGRLWAAAALVVAVGAPSLAVAKDSSDKGDNKLEDACLLVGEVYTKAPLEELKTTFVLLDVQSGEVVWDVDSDLLSSKPMKGGYEVSAFIPSDPDMQGQVFEWALRVDAREASSPVYIDWFEQVVTEKWAAILGEKTIAAYPGGDIAGRVELVAITKSKTNKGKGSKKHDD